MTTVEGKIVVIGDSHIGLAEGAETKMVAWLERLRDAGPLALYLNGDVFHYFIGDPKFETAAVRNFFATLDDVKRSGIAVYYVEGNRDFFIEGSIAEPAVTAVSLRETIQAGSRRFLITHGDMINERDYPYRLWRRASKNPVTRFGVKLWPKKSAKRFVDGVEERLARSNFKHKYRLPTELMKNYAMKRAAEGIDIVVFGHFHQKVELSTDGATVIVLPAWFDSGEAMVIDPKTGEWEWGML